MNLVIKIKFEYILAEYTSSKSEYMNKDFSHE